MSKTNKKSYERRLHQRQIESFLDSNGVLFPLRKVIKGNNDYQIEFRKSYFNIYYKGGNLLKIKGSKKFRFDFDIDYCNNKPETKYKEQIKSIIEAQDISKAIAHLDWFTYEMDSWWEVHNKPERINQHCICQENRKDEKEVYVVDIEYAATGYGRADILAVKYNEQTHKYKVYIVEYKQGNDAISSGIRVEDNKVIITSSQGDLSAGIYKHYLDASSLVKFMRQDLLNTIRNSIYIRNLFGFANFPLAANADTIQFEDEVEMRFVFSDYKKQRDDRDKIERELAAVRLKEEESHLKWKCVYLNANNYSLKEIV